MLVASLNTVLAGIAPEALDITANVMVAGGLAVFIAMMFRHAWRYGVDPFHGAPVRGSRITPMLVLLPFTGFFVASLVLQPVAELYKDEPAEEVVRLSCNSLSQALGRDDVLVGGGVLLSRQAAWVSHRPRRSGAAHAGDDTAVSHHCRRGLRAGG